jgi:hypothetical protein
MRSWLEWRVISVETQGYITKRLFLFTNVSLRPKSMIMSTINFSITSLVLNSAVSYLIGSVTVLRDRLALLESFQLHPVHSSPSVPTSETTQRSAVSERGTMQHSVPHLVRSLGTTSVTCQDVVLCKETRNQLTTFSVCFPVLEVYFLVTS